MVKHGLADPLRGRSMRMRRFMGGITLIELMIVIVILSVLVAIAYPNYREFAARAKRTEARAALLEIAAAQERFYLQNQEFGNMGELGYDDPWITDSESYAVTVTANDAADFTAQAAYQFGGEEALKCNLFTINGAGVKLSNPDGDCWTRTR